MSRNGPRLRLEVLHMADADVLPYDYVTYGKEISAYLDSAQKKAQDAGLTGIDFAPAKPRPKNSSSSPSR